MRICVINNVLDEKSSRLAMQAMLEECARGLLDASTTLEVRGLAHAPTHVEAGVEYYRDTFFQLLSTVEIVRSIARKPAMADLLGRGATDASISEQAGYSTMIMMIGWAVGGVIFGILGDRLGRAKTMSLTILLFTIFTGLSFFAANVWQFNVYRFLCSLGVGGQFAVGVALVAEVMPERARPYALGTVQALSSVGNVTAGFVGIVLGQMERSGEQGPASLAAPTRCEAFLVRRIHQIEGHR